MKPNDYGPELVARHTPEGGPPMIVTGAARSELARRAATGEPDPYIVGCLRCGSTDGVQAFTVPNPAFSGRTGQPKSLYDWERVDPSTSDEFKSITVCSCCSFDGCPHPTWDPDCPSCGRPIAAEGKWATRCPVDGEHGAAVAS